MMPMTRPPPRPMPLASNRNNSGNNNTNYSSSSNGSSNLATRPRPALLAASKKPTAIGRRVSAPAQLTGNGNSNWSSLTETALENVPPFYTISTDSVRVCGNVSVSEVAGRVAEWLRMRSVAAVFDGCVARCRTLDRCEFEVRIFREGDHLLVEVNMTRGDAFSYQTHSEAVLNAAQGVMSEMSSDIPSPCATLPNLPLSIGSSDANENGSTDILDVLENTSELIQKDRVDACMIGMETLAVLTKPDKVGKKVAALTSRAVILGTVGEGDIIDFQTGRSLGDSTIGGISNEANSENESDSDQDGTDDMGFMSIVFALVRDKKLQPEDEDDVNLSNPSFLYHLRFMRLLAFATIDNALQVMYDTNPCLRQRIARHFDRHGLFESLINDISDARQNPHEAWYAVRILTWLASTSETSRQRALQLGALDAAEGARLHGLTSHELLASDSNTLMIVLRLQSTSP